jgi:hypothetical protein
VRVHPLPAPLSVDPALATGCRSWIPLPGPLAAGDLPPIVPDPMWTSRLREVHLRLESAA